MQVQAQQAFHQEQITFKATENLQDGMMIIVSRHGDP